MKSDCIIFSMDRALQLYSTLSSYYDNVKNDGHIYIVYRATNENHLQAYYDLISLFKDRQITFIMQNHRSEFRDIVLQCLRSIATETMFFSIDDTLFIEPCDINAIPMFSNSLFSLRMGKHLIHCDIVNKPQPLPTFVSEKQDICSWKWKDGQHDWGYALSVDGHLFNTADIVSLSEKTMFDSPNTYEGNLQGYHLEFINKIPFGICYSKARILNIPINKVQTDNSNPSGDISPEYLLDMWNKGYCIDHIKFYGFINKSLYQIEPINFIKRT